MDQDERPPVAGGGEEEPRRAQWDGPPLAVIGASAGGIEALQALLPELKPELELAYLVMLHQARDRDGQLEQVLSRASPLPLQEVRERTKVERGTVYLAHPNHPLRVADGHLEPSEEVSHDGIDLLLRSAAEACGPAAIAIILSGSGCDGSLGIKAIKAEGGLVIVQDLATAIHPGMPRSAIATRLADCVLPPDRIPERLSAVLLHSYLTDEEAVEEAADDGTLNAILALLSHEFEPDFRVYKDGTIVRRILRRMSLRQISTLADYLSVLREDVNEAAALHDDLLISVTHFFRDPEAWEELATQVLRPLIAEAESQQPVRIWVAGCATGEEAYSMAISFLEQRQQLARSTRVQIFASDIDHHASTFARSGVYPSTIAADVSEKRLRQFFVPENGGYRVSKEVRECVVFAHQNLLDDPPFSRLDLIACRNLLIYLKPAAQKRLLGLFHFGLRENGYLYLGSAETIGQQSDLFEALSRRHRIYRRIGGQRLDQMPILFGSAVNRESAGFSPPLTPRLSSNLETVATDLVLQRFAPACLLIDHRNEILYLRGSVSRYLQQPSGRMTSDLLAWTGPELRAKIRGALHTVHPEQPKVEIRNVQFPNIAAPVNVIIEYLSEPKELAALRLVRFEEVGPPEDRDPAQPVALDEPLYQRLETELQETKDDLQSSIEQLETSNEELKAANEEVTSINEELQSTNEELETSKEELQSLNEELATVNNQLAEKVQELELAHDNLSNLLASTHTPTIFLDLELRVRWFTAATSDVIPVRKGDVGRPIADFSVPLQDANLIAEAEAVLETLVPRTREVSGPNGRWYIQRVVPYRTEDNRIEGVVVTFSDITERRQAEEGQRQLATVVRESQDAIAVLELDGTVRDWNQGAEQLLGYTVEQAVGRSSIEFTAPEDRDRYEAALRAIGGSRSVIRLEVQRVRRDGQRRDTQISLSALKDNHGEPVAIASIERDITQQKRSAEQLEEQVRSRTRLLVLLQRGAMIANATEPPEEAFRQLIGLLCEQLPIVGGKGWVRQDDRGAEPITPWLRGESLVEVPASVGAKLDRAVAHLLDADHLQALDAADARLKLAPSEEPPATFLHLPIIGSHRPMGSLILAAEASLGEALDEELRRVLGEVGAQLGHVLERHRAAASLRAVTTEMFLIEQRERRLLAEQLHDQLGQLLALAQIRLSAEKESSPDIAEADRHIRQANDIVRAMVFDLDLPLLEIDGLPAALQSLADKLHQEHHLTTSVHVAEDLAALSEEAQLITFRAIRERTNNVIKHADARKIEVTVTSHNEHLEVVVRDDGHGFDTADGFGKGFGLLSIRERLSYLGGDLQIESADGAGTLARMTIPIDDLAGQGSSG